MKAHKVIRDYQARKQAKKEHKLKNRKLILPADMKAEEVPTKTILEKPIKMNRICKDTQGAFGISHVRNVEILRKMIAVAQLYPKYSTIAEVILNCSDRFTEMERMWGLFVLGRVQGTAGILRKQNIHIKFDAATMPLEGRLLAIMSKQVLVEDKVLNKILEGGKHG